MRAAFLCAAITLLAASADAEEERVVVLPFVTAGSGLDLYSSAVAKGVVKELRRGTTNNVVAATDSGSVQRNVSLVVDGRIVKVGNGLYILEAQVRDPLLGRVVGAAATKAAALADLDTLATDLGTRLVPVIARGLQERQAEANKAPVVAADPKQSSAGGHAPPASVDRRPALVIPIVGGRAAHGAISVGESATRAVVELANRLGFSPRVVSQRSTLEPSMAGQLVRRDEANFALLFIVEDIRFDWKGVLTAHGRVRVEIVDGAGNVLFTRRYSTDTLVGSRGDRHDALVYFVAAQGAAMAFPQVRQVLVR